jgi:hypothetical protein
VKTNPLIAPTAVAIVVALAAGGWFTHREWKCDRLAQSIPGDIQVKRGSDGQCYICRDEGWLYDIAYPTCAASDRPYKAG